MKHLKYYRINYIYFFLLFMLYVRHIFIVGLVNNQLLCGGNTAYQLYHIFWTFIVQYNPLTMNYRYRHTVLFFDRIVSCVAFLNPLGSCNCKSVMVVMGIIERHNIHNRIQHFKYKTISTRITKIPFQLLNNIHGNP